MNRRDFIGGSFCGVCMAAVLRPSLVLAQGSITAQAAFEKLKNLAGEWQGTVEDSGKGTPATVVYKLTANNSVVLETLGPGTQHEMVSAYHMNGNQLMMTHYCSAGNQPRMVLDKQSTPDRLVFLFAGGTNLRPEKDVHIHDVRFKWINNDNIESEWDGYKDGKKAGTTKFVLSRKK